MKQLNPLRIQHNLVYISSWRFAAAWVVFNHGERRLATSCRTHTSGAAHQGCHPITKPIYLLTGVSYFSEAERG
ncbi:hypothetical protein DPMN_084479 [Dreissena polymorpha]|uniref:Uncharacterized protein n=1 Tax=Dreissena polymorpha TaxID=45954 RepID=A0A9D3YB33_DREPO|nr:hypothetical protein DPMN_084479 [Dreissena polymorpha]